MGSVRGAKEPAAKTPAAAAEPKAKSAAPKAAPKKGSGKGVGTTKGRKKPAPEFYQEWESQGRTWAVGDDAYLVETDDHMQLPLEDHDDLCCVCEKGNKRNSMIECARCLGGFHMGCLKPKLKAVPEGDWLCPGCVAGCALPNRKLRTAADQFLWGDHVLGLAYIDGIVANRSGDGRVEVACRYYLTPEQTHAGRQEHNTTREVYLTTQVHYEPIESLFWPAVVCKPSEADDHEGNDVFSCEYMYDEAYKRFVRRVYKGHGGGDDAGAAASDSDASDADWDAGLASGSGSEGDDAEFDVVAEGGARASGGGAGKGGKGSKGGRVAKPIYQFWAERGMLTGGLPKKLRGGIDAVLASTGGAGKLALYGF
ncbi:hypothetical protein FOA52_011372 [Chlamydomonas sp. UWO 241]|nr:hypothetical protein FOA52_011372 [Chlamydomonas sp. UWO 241]